MKWHVSQLLDVFDVPNRSALVRAAGLEVDGLPEVPSRREKELPTLEM